VSTSEFRKLQKLFDRAVLDGGRWREAGDRLAEYLGGVGTVFVPEDLESQGPWLAHSDSLTELVSAVFRDGWHLRNFRRKAIPIIKQRGFATDLDIADAETMRREPFYNELIASQRLGFFIGLNIQVGRQSWIAAVERAADAAVPDRTLFDRAERVLPALADAARASFALGRKRLESWKDILAEQDRGLFLVDFLGRVIDRNAASEALLKTGLRLKNRRIQLSDAYADAAFQRLLNSACAVTAEGDLPSPVFWRGADDVLLVADIVRLKPNLRSFHSLEAALVVVRPVGRAKVDLSGLLKRKANLTDAELRLAVALFEGHSLADYASNVGNTIGTVRQQLKSIFRKTQTGRQAELLTWMRKLQASEGS
jgi:DNA-binding CsgD family transcriptional regulator